MISARARLRALPALGLFALVMLASAPPASAGISWCRADPVFDIGGRVGHVYVLSDGAMMTKATGKIKVRITVPEDVNPRLLSADAGFGFGYEIRFVKNDEWEIDFDEDDDDGDGFTRQFPINVAVYAPASDGRLPVRIEFVSNDGTVSVVTGAANSWVTVKSYL